MQMAQLINDPTIRLLGGESGLSRAVSAVGVIEAPDIEEYLVPAQLLLTTGYHYYQDLTKLTHLIKQMAASGCAGLGIKADRYFKQIPDSVIALADQVGLPLVVTPADQNLSAVVKHLTELVIGSDALVLSRTIEQNQQLSALAMANANYNTVLEAIATWFHHEIVLLDSHCNVVYSSTRLAAVQSTWSEVFQSAVPDHFHLSKPLTINRLQHRVTILPLMVMYPENKAFIGLFDLDTPTKVEQLQLQQIQNVLSLMNSRTDVANESAVHMENNFFFNMLNGTLSDDLLRHRLQDYALQFDQRCYCAIVELTAASSQTLVSLREIDTCRRLCNWFVAEHKLPVTVFVADSQVVLVIQAAQTPRPLLENLLPFLSANVDEKFVLKAGFSQACMTLQKLPALYQEAKEAVTLAKQGTANIAKFRPKEASELLHLIPQSEGASFVQGLLGPLLELSNTAESQELLHTLRLYLYNNQQVNAVAKQLFIHRNTVTYRLKKISQILDADLSDPGTCERLNLALLLHQKN